MVAAAVSYYATGAEDGETEEFDQMGYGGKGAASFKGTDSLLIFTFEVDVDLWGWKC